MASLRPACFSDGISIRPNAHLLFHTHQKLAKAKKRRELVQLFLKNNPHKMADYLGNKTRLIGPFGLHLIDLCEGLNKRTQERALKVDKALKQFLPESFLKPLASIGLAIGATFKETVEDIVGGYRADLELIKNDIDRWIQLTLLQNIFKFYSGKLDSERNGFNPHLKKFLDASSIDVPLDPVRAPNQKIADRTAFLKYLEKVQELINEYISKIEQIDGEIVALENVGGPVNFSIRDQLLAKRSAFQQEINRLNETNFDPKKDLVNLKFNIPVLTEVLNEEIEKECSNHILHVENESLDQLQNMPPSKPLTSLQKKLAQQFIASYQQKVKEMSYQIRGMLDFQDKNEENRELLVHKFEQLCERSLEEALQIPEVLLS